MAFPFVSINFIRYKTMFLLPPEGALFIASYSVVRMKSESTSKNISEMIGNKFLFVLCKA